MAEISKKNIAKKYNPYKCIYCGKDEIYESVKDYAKKLNRAAGFTRGGHRGQTSKKIGVVNE